MKAKWIDFLENNAITLRDKIAIIDQQSRRRLTYGELNAEVNRWAAYLASRDIGRGDSIVFLATNRLEHLTLLLAVAKLGAVFVPLNFRLSPQELQEVVHKLEPKLYLGIGPKVLDVNVEYVDVSRVDLHHSSTFVPDYSTLDDTILMLFTSGSTGVPKGVMLHGRMLLANQMETCRHWKLQLTDTTVVETPFFHTGGYNVFLLPLLHLGGTCILASGFDPDNVFDCIERERITVYFGVPTMFQMLLEHPRFEQTDFSSIRFFVSGGAACPVSLIEAYQRKGLMFKQGFGLTEVGPNCFLLEEKYSMTKAGSIGVPMSHSSVRVVNQEGAPVDAGTPGELLIAGPHVCKGYYRNEAEFSKVCKGGFFHTGDLVRFDEDGFFYVVGRIKDLYISGGENVYPGEVEKQLTAHPEIQAAVVVAVPSPKWGEVGHAFLLAERDLTAAEVREFLTPRLSRYKHPHFVERLGAFPLLPNGKVDRKELKRMAIQAADFRAARP